MATKPQPSHQLTENVKLLQKAVLLHRGEVLLLQRSSAEQSRPNCWDTPGGNSEWPTGHTQNVSNPHFVDICREIQEETGIAINPQSLAHTQVVYHETFYEPEREVFTVLFGWKIVLPEDFDRNQVRVSTEHRDFMWATPDMAQEQDFGGVRGAFMNRILSTATSEK